MKLFPTWGRTFGIAFLLAASIDAAHFPVRVSADDPVADQPVSAEQDQAEPEVQTQPAEAEPVKAEPAKPEPVGFDVVQRCIKESGGKDAFAAVKSIVMRGTIAVLPNVSSAKAANDGETSSDSIDNLTTGTIETFFVAPNRAKVIVDLGALGRSERGINGSFAWESSASGVRVLSSAERARLLDSISMRETFQPTQVFSSITNRGKQLVDDTPCYRLELTRRGGQQVDQVFFSIETGLPVRTIAMRNTLGGERLIDSKILQYKTFEGIEIATKVRQELEAFKMIHDVEIEKVTINSEIDQSLFSPPPDLSSAQTN